MCFGSCGRSPGWCSMCFVTKLTAACPPRPSRHMRLELTARCIVLGMPLLSLHAAKLVERGKEYTWRAVRQEAWGIYEEYDGPCHFCGLIDDEPPEPVAKEDKWIGFRKSVERVKTSFCRENIAETNMHDLTVKDKETDPWNIRNGLREGVLRGGNRCCSSVKSPDKKLPTHTVPKCSSTWRRQCIVQSILQGARLFVRADGWQRQPDVWKR
eukprot:gnl/TRDRNA2_/TRDRNA2_176434_c4_seq9.p1 gnl/TRDRNA2_/TRDRNA2_176434_c4~~gnl/TRDRNA2_/TRDRNA2_176434_c4_seq9.p1  ORF type:complete len:212 (-),score=18.51 gnl/TRDRNA2_/TRDRNA2_176434_c4_seq9:264-899(-)